MNKKISKIVTATVLTSLLTDPVYLILDANNVNAETTKTIDEEMKRKKEIGNALLNEINNSKKDFKDPSIAEKLKIQVENYRDCVAERGKATLTAKVGGKAIKATVNKVGEKAWNKLVEKVEKTSEIKLVMFHYQSINKFCDILTVFEGNLADVMLD